MYIYQRVRDTREDNGKTQKDIADYLNEHLTTYNRWENGDSEIPCHIVKELAKLYGCTCDYLLSIQERTK